MLIYITGVLLIAYLGWGAMLYIMQPKFLYGPVREVAYTPGELELDFEDITFKSSDGLRLSGWYIPAPLEMNHQVEPTQLRSGLLTGPEEDSEFTVLFCHGNGGNIAHRLDSINIFHNLGLNCFIFDYRGYGSSEGKPNEQGTYLDAGAAYQWLREEKKISPDNIIIFGRSLGGSIAAQLAGKVKARALVIEGAFTSFADIGQKFYPYMPVRWFARFNYRTIDYIKNVDCPVMLIYSRNDDIVPFEFGPKLYEAANEPKELVEIFGSHNDAFLVSGEIYQKAWIKWLKFLKEYKGQSISYRAS